MHEEVLKRFFLGEASAKEFADDLADSLAEGQDVSCLRVRDMRDDFRVRPEHLVRLCDAVLSGALKAKHLEAIGFCIAASDRFGYRTLTPEGALGGKMVREWSEPGGNYPPTVENVLKFRERLVTGRDPFPDEGTG